MKKILIIYPSMMVGGSTTSILSILNMLEYEKYQVDLLLLRSSGKLQNLIPDKVNIRCAMPNSDNMKFKLRKAISPQSIFHLVQAKFAERKNNSASVRSQIMNKDTLRFCATVDEEYDVAIAFLECWALYMLESKVKAKKKIAWIHLNYIESRLDPKYDRDALSKMDKVVLVSDSCKEAFDCVFPEFSDKSLVVENILSQVLVQQRSHETTNYVMPQLDTKRIHMVSVCRIVFYHKGLDRGLKALYRLKSEGYDISAIAWYIIGDGPDREQLQAMINDAELTENIFICGEHINPLPLEKQCEIFFLPSVYEGKPMAVTEAQMLGILPIVTNYSSANEQIHNGEDGVIIPNDDESIYRTLKQLVSGEINTELMQNNVRKTDFSNIKEFEKIIELIED